MRLILVLFLSLAANVAYAEIIFNDPTGREFNEAYSQFSESRLKDLNGDDKHLKEYLLGVLYVNSDQEFGVKKDCHKAVSLLKKAWGAEVVDAGFTLATMYYDGVCVNKDLAKVRSLAADTAEDGYILSQRMLGRAYWGRAWKDLYPKDMEKAIFWLSKAGDAGDTQSAGALSAIYRKGVGVEIDEKKSFYWARESAFSKYEPGKIINFFYLAGYYEKGVGTNVDLVNAYKYYDLSGTAGIESKKRIAKEMTQEQIDEATRLSEQWQKENNVEIGGGFIRRAN